VEAGKMFGTEEQFIFFKAEVVCIRFPLRGQSGDESPHSDKSQIPTPTLT
jgi:hypothetical protein